MNKLLTALLLTFAPAVATADEVKAPTTQPVKDARIIPSLKNGKQDGWKVYAIRAGGKFDRAGAKFENGDTIEQVDGVPVIEEAGARLFNAKVLEAKGDATITLTRKGVRIELSIKGE